VLTKNQARGKVKSHQGNNKPTQGDKTMTIIDENTTREELEMAILQHDELYESFDEVKLLVGGYTPV
jgi:hypothetical protein